MLAALLFCVCAVLAAGYLGYGRIVARGFALNDNRATPAVTKNDGDDFVPTPKFYLLGQHFSAISAAGPIAGPIIAAQLFGWLPCVLWIGIGVVFVGAVHDLSALVASVRHEGESVAELFRRHLGRQAWIAIMVFIWIALTYVIVAFTDITAATFLGKTDDIDGYGAFNPGGAVAFASIAYLLTSLTMGIVQKLLAPPLWVATLIFVPLTFASVWLGTQFSTLFVLTSSQAATVWGLSILAYCFVAAQMPVWLLLQPRGYLGGFVLYTVLGLGSLGMIIGSVTGRAAFDIRLPAFRAWDAGGPTGLLFPFLFVTIACGACSGFHGLVCSGTTSKQLAQESHAHPIGYGAMLLEAFVAILALSTVMTLVPGAPTAGPGRIYGDGMGRYLAVLLGEEHLVFAMTFGAMAFSTFVFDTLDVSTRLGRYILEELFGLKARLGRIVASSMTLALPALLIATVKPTGNKPAYMVFWSLFGASNQLLAALTLLGVTVWLAKEGRRIRYTLIPAVFVSVITIWALALQLQSAAVDSLKQPTLGTSALNAITALALLGLGLSLMFQAIRKLGAVRAQRAPTSP